MTRAIALVLALAAASCAGAHTPSGSQKSPPSLPMAAGPSQPVGPVVTDIQDITIDWDSQPDTSSKTAREAPLSLTASDGVGLRVVSLEARAVVEGPLAFTELHAVFENPESRTVEGTFAIALPPAATISRFAMKQERGWQEGEVVELQAARRAYEDALHRRVDPALLEKQAGNQFRARVFPIPASGRKELVISYTQELTREGDPYVLPLLGLPRLDQLDVQLLLPRAEGGGKGKVVHKRAYQPDRDFAFDVHGASAGALRRGNLAVARVVPVTEAKEAPVDALVVLFDTSASRALGFAAQVDGLGALVASLRGPAGGAIPLRVACFDQDVAEVYRGPASGFGDASLAKIKARRALGASDVGKALAWAGDASRDVKGARVVVVTDGVATAGATEAGALKAQLAALATAGAARLDVVLDGGIRDEALAKELVRGTLPADGVVVSASLGPARIAGKLRRAAFGGIPVEVAGATWSWPEQLDGVQPGDEVLVYAELPPDRALAIAVGNAPPRAIDTAPAPGPLLERAAVSAHIRRLTRDRSLATADDAKEALRHTIVDLSTRYRVLSDFTGIVVLETEDDYARFHIDRRALRDILVVGGRGVEIGRREDAPVAAAPPASFYVRHAFVHDPESRDEPRPRGIAGPTLQEAPTGGTSPAPPTRTMPSPTAPPMPGDHDGDGVPDQADRCPEEPENVNGVDDDDGCPDQARVIVESSSIRVLQSIHFADGRAEILPESLPIVDALVQVMKGEAWIEKVEIGGHTDGRGDAAGNVRLSEARARAIRDKMIAAGVDGGRLVAKGYGASRPRVIERSDDDRSLNRRVEFRILRASGEDVPQPPPGPPVASTPRSPSGAAAPARVPPYEGTFLDVMTLLQKKKNEEARARAQAWRDKQPEDALAIVALGESLEALGKGAEASRAYGSLVDLFPGRADMRRFAGAHLERVPQAKALAIDTLGVAAKQRPDHPSGQRLYAYALLRAGEPEKAFEVLEAAVRRGYPDGRFAGVDRVLKEDLGLVAAAWTRAQPKRKDEIATRTAAAGSSVATSRSLRFVLNWETDANDVDFHIEDAKGGHAFYATPALPSGGRLYADVTTGYGPECFAIDGIAAAYPYRLRAHYFSRGPMGYGMGKLEIVEHDGAGGLRFDERPFLVMRDQAFVDLGAVIGPLPAAR